jgi:hypothetical protein
MARERWRKIRRAPGYEVSDQGRVRSVDRILPGGRAAGGVVLSPQPDRDGYLRVSLNGEMAYVAHLVLEAFVSPRPYGMEACHSPCLSEGRQDCRLSVLRWDTRRENARDKKRASDEGRGGWIWPPSKSVAPVAPEVQG